MTALLTEDVDGIAFLTLNRPDKRNALNDELISSLKTALGELEKAGTTKCAVIRGAGKDFCSGADLSALQKIAESDVVENLEDARSLMELFLLLRNVSFPVVAAVTGRALAGGCGLATACDLVVASDDARFGYPEIRIGFVPAMVMAILRRNLSEKRAFELIARGFDFSATEAERIGMINEVFEVEKFDERLNDYVSPFRKTSASALKLSKNLLYQMDGSNFEEALNSGAQVNAIARMTEDCQKGIAKFLNK